MTILQAPRALESDRNGDLTLTVARLETLADGVLAVDLTSGSPLPVWTAGAHIDLRLDGLVRQYSLCGDPEDEHTYRIAVLRAPDSAGGSAYVHERLRVGDVVAVSRPRNHFELQPAPSYLFIAGGIGITPILAMIRAAERQSAEWRLLYGGRTLASMAFRDELSRHGDRVRLQPEDETGLLDLESALGTPLPGTLVYCCGPESLLTAVERHCQAWPGGSLHTERFTPRTDLDDSADTAFEVEFRRSGVTAHVPTGTSVLAVAREHGIDLDSSCTSGVCGTCESKVIEGEPDHRDSVLTDSDRDEGYFMPCVSRCRSGRLVLDL
ncbi:PDR/VanB family oxidoreductase [Actinocorallia sp. B10E7]|uniref:PDR/VanB family oxidoreductase n=1 Tax=Actinocorallia sp. B10E7 TaxID=3153558 RepID=UPI00325C3E35